MTLKDKLLSVASKILCVVCLIAMNVLLTFKYNVPLIACIGICVLVVMWALNGGVWMIELINSLDKEKRE